MNKTRNSIRSSTPFAFGDWRFWILDIFHEKIQFDAESKENILCKIIPEIEKKHLSNEFNYLKTGFIFFHSGRRGTTISVWHWAEWSGTFEVFNSAWYCYEHNRESVEFLDLREPVMCNLDLEIVFNELSRFKISCDNTDNLKEIINHYLNKA